MKIIIFFIVAGAMLYLIYGSVFGWPESPRHLGLNYACHGIQYKTICFGERSAWAYFDATTINQK